MKLPGLGENARKALYGPDGRAFAVLGVATAIAAVWHFGCLSLFAWLSVSEMVWFNVFSIVLYLAALASLLRKPDLVRGSFIISYETTMHAIGSSITAGPQLGFQYYVLVNIAVVLMVSPLRYLKYFVPMMLLQLSVFTTLQLGSIGAQPLYRIDGGILATVGVINVASVFFIGIACIMAFVVVLENTERELELEKSKSESLLLNVLPASIANRLKQGEKIIADSFDCVSVVFADIVSFTTYSAERRPVDLVAMLDEIFRRFDHEATLLGLEKIKTIGDCYMAVAGLPEPCADHAERALKFSGAVLKATASFNRDFGQQLQLRVGVCSGAVTAGVIGSRKFAYDLWGDAVNTASRMESHGVPGAVMLTESTRSLLPPGLSLIDNGVRSVKGKGEMQTWLYFVEAT